MARERGVLLRAVGRLRESEAKLLDRLAQYADNAGNIKHPTPTRALMAETGLAQSTLELARRRLRARGLIETQPGTGRASTHYRVLVPAGVSEVINDVHRYRPRHLWTRRPRGKTQGLNGPPYKGSRARRDAPRVLDPSPTATPRESCRRHPDKPGKACRACGTSRRQQGANPRADRTNPRAGYVTPIPPRFEPAPAGVAPPPGLLESVRQQLATLNDRRSRCTA